MKKSNSILKIFLSAFILGNLFSVSFASTTQKGRDIFDQLKDDGRTNYEIRKAMNDLGYNADEYLGKSSSTSGKTTALGRSILNQYRADGRTNEEIKEALEDLGLDTSGYFPESKTTSYSSSSISTYISRSCKPYSIEYISSLNAYTSPDLIKKEYFVNIDYLKRYIDSKNAQSTECYIDGGWISSPYIDNNTSDKYIAPNGKIYFIKTQDGSYTSNELSSYRSFKTIDELRNYIKERNPLISMGMLSSRNNVITDLYNELFY